MFRARRGPSQVLLLVAGPVLAVVAFVVTYYANPLDFKGQTALASIPAFLLAVVILLISHNLAAYRELEEVSSHSDRIYEAVKDYLHVTKVGPPEAAFQYIISRLPIVDEVRNTSLNLRQQSERADEKFYESDTYQEAMRSIAEWTAKGVRWKDIGDHRGVERLRSIHRMALALERNRHARYQYRLISHREPQINFILLSFRDQSTEVLFNWDFRNIGEDPHVLLSRDRDIVQMFAVQFEYLWRVASLDHDTTDTRSTSA